MAPEFILRGFWFIESIVCFVRHIHRMDWLLDFLTYSTILLGGLYFFRLARSTR